MKKILLLVAAWLCFFSISAQQVVQTSNLDSTVSHIIAPLDKSDITSDLFLDKAFKSANVSRFDGTGNSDTTKNYSLWHRVYTTLATAELDGTNPIPSTNSWEPDVEDFKENQVIPLVALHFDYHQFITDSAQFSNLVYFQNDQLHDVPGRPYSPYVENTAFAVAPFKETILDSLNVTFRFDDDLYFTNTTKTIDSILVDFDNGQGSQHLIKNQNQKITYSTYGVKNLAVEIVYTDQTSYLAKTQVNIKQTNPPGPSLLGLGGYDDVRDDTLMITSDLDSTYGAIVEIEYGCGEQKLRKPLILMDGFNPAELTPENPRGLTYESFIDYMDKFATKYFDYYPLKANLEEGGYDIVYIDFDHGAGDLRKNADIVKKTIERVNEIKAENNSTEPNILYGVSMGGVLSRYALLEMEDAGIPHDVSYYFSIDAPHLGANIPLGVQYAIRDLYEVEIDDERPYREQMEPFINVFDHVGTKQLLRYYAYGNAGNSNTTTDFVNFQAELDGRMPAETWENIAVAQGNGNGIGQGFNAGDMILHASANPIEVHDMVLDDADLPWWIEPLIETIGWVEIFVFSLPEYTSSPQTLYYADIYIQVGPQVKAEHTKQMITTNTQPYDNAPGGVRTVVDDETLGSVGGDMTLDINITDFCFIPTFSALNISDNIDDPHAPIDPVAAVNNGDSDFDRAFVFDPTSYPPSFDVDDVPDNEIHGNITPTTVDIMAEVFLDKVDDLGSLTYLSSSYNISRGDGVTINDRLITPLTLEDTDPAYTLCVNCNNRVGDISDSNNPLSDIAHYTLQLTTDCDFADYGEIVIEDGATLKIGESSNKTGSVMIGANSKIEVKSGGKIEINEGSSLLVQGGELIIDGGEIVCNGGEIIVGEDGKMDYYENSEIQLNGSDAILSLAGLTYIKDNAVFGFSYTGNESGHIEIAEGTWGIRFRTGVNTQIHLEGEGDDDLILDIIGSDFWAEPDEGEGDESPVNITLRKGRIDFHDGGARFYANREFYAFLCHFTHPPGQLPSGYSNRGIRLGGDSRFMACEFTRVPIDGRLNYTQSGMLDLADCDLDRSDVYLQTRGFEFSSCTFERSSVRSENCTVLSEIDASDFHLSPVEDFSSNQLKVNRSTFDNAPGRFALYKDAGRLLVRCSEFTDNDIAVYGSSAELIMSDAKSTGYNRLYGNDINLKTDNLENLNITFGYNMFVSGNDFNIHGLWHGQPYDFLCPSPLYTVDFRGNLWSANPPTSVPPYPYPNPAQFDLTSRIQSGEPFGECQVNPQFGSIVASMPTCPSSSVPGRSSSSTADTTLADYFADMPNDSIPLISTDTYGEILADTALYLANNLLEINDSLSQNSLAMSAFKDVLKSLKDSISHDYTWKLAFDGISGMKTAFEHEEAQNGVESSEGFSPMVQDYVDILMLYTDSVKTEENYNRQFYLETKKASLFNTLGNLSLAEQILGNLNLCEHDSLEQDYLDKYRNMLGNQIAMSEVSSYELMMDSTLSETLLDSTYSSSPPHQTVGDQGFAAFIEGPNTVQFTTCPVGQQKSLDISSENEASLNLVTISSRATVADQKVNAELKIYSSQGRNVFSKEYVVDGRFSESVSVENLTVGSYIVVLNVKGKAYRAHLVVVK